MISAQPPSLSTKPLRSASNGREAVSGSGFLVSAVIWANAATVSGIVAASGSAGDHQVAVAVADQAHRLADRVVGRGARRHRAVVGSGEAEVHGDVTAGGVGHEHRHHERRHPPGALLAEHVVLVEQRLHAADAGGVDHGAAFGPHLGLAGIGPCELRGRDRVLGERVGAARLLGVQVVGGHEPGHLAGHGDRQIGVVERGDLGDPVAPGREALPEVLDADARPASPARCR